MHVDASGLFQAQAKSIATEVVNPLLRQILTGIGTQLLLVSSIIAITGSVAWFIIRARRKQWSVALKTAQAKDMTSNPNIDNSNAPQPPVAP
jgi:hypothetical protein